MRVWRRSWEDGLKMEPLWINLIIVIVTIPLFFEITGRMFKIKFIGLCIGIVISLIKTAYDYVYLKYF
ncbi:MAG TPA: hypothetical protein ENI33_09495 [Thermoplasmatales archaeon]|nr:hypothetical protein [Thermoplasmatales archaeon]